MSAPRKKVLIVASWYPRPSSPINGIFVRDQAHALATRYDVAVLDIVPAGLLLYERLQNARTPSAEAIEDDGVVRRTTTIPAPTNLPKLFYPVCIRAVNRAFQQITADWGMPDIIHAHVTLPAGWAAVHLGERHGIPVVVTEHTSSFSMHLGTRLSCELVRHTMKTADRMVAVSPMLADRMHEFEATVPIHVIGNLIRTDFFVPNPIQAASARTRFLSVALLNKKKGLDYLLRAARLLMDRGVSGFELAIGGEGPERARLQRLAEELRLTERCTFLGLLDPAAVRSEVHRCDVFVTPSLHESFCIVIGEAMACGKPVVATRSGGPEYVVAPGTGYLVTKGNAEDLADAMARAMVEEWPQPEAIRATVVERFGQKAFLRNVSGLYEEIWSKRRTVPGL